MSVFYWNTLQTPPSNVILTYTDNYKSIPYLITITSRKENNQVNDDDGTRKNQHKFKVKIYKHNKQFTKPHEVAFNKEPILKFYSNQFFKNTDWITVATVFELDTQVYLYVGTFIMLFKTHGNIKSLTTFTRLSDDHFFTYVTTDNNRYYLLQEQSWVPKEEADRYEDPYLYFEECCDKTFVDPDTGKKYKIAAKKHLRHKSFDYDLLDTNVSKTFKHKFSQS